MESHRESLALLTKYIVRALSPICLVGKVEVVIPKKFVTRAEGKVLTRKFLTLGFLSIYKSCHARSYTPILRVYRPGGRDHLGCLEGKFEEVIPKGKRATPREKGSANP